MPRPATMSEPLHISEIFSSIQGEGMLAGRRQIFIRLAECNLVCRYCDTLHEKSAFCSIETEPGSNFFGQISQPVALHTCLELVGAWVARMPGAHHSISITGGEPLLGSAILGEWLAALRRILPVHLETNGTLPAELKEVIEDVDFISMDMKLPSTSGTQHLWDLHRRFLEVAVNKHVSVKVVVGDESSAEEIDQVCAIITAIDRSIPLFLQPLTLSEGGVGINAEKLLHLQERAAAQLPDVMVIPQMHKLLGVL